MPKRRKPSARKRLEDRALEMEPCSQLREQQRLQAMNHTQQENDAARRRCRELLEGGWGSISWLDEPDRGWGD
jgi:hypothetical protein